MRNYSKCRNISSTACLYVLANILVILSHTLDFCNFITTQVHRVRQIMQNANILRYQKTIKSNDYTYSDPKCLLYSLYAEYISYGVTLIWNTERWVFNNFAYFAECEFQCNFSGRIKLREIDWYKRLHSTIADIW